MFETADGHINIAAAGEHLFARMCRAMGSEEFLDDPRFCDGHARYENRDTLNAAIEEFTRREPSAHWVALLNEAGVPCGPIYAVDQTFADPQVRHLDMTKPVEHPALGAVHVVDHAVNMSRTEPQMRRASPEAGGAHRGGTPRVRLLGGRDRRLPRPRGGLARPQAPVRGARAPPPPPRVPAAPVTGSARPVTAVSPSPEPDATATSDI